MVVIERTDAELVATLQSSPEDLDELYRRHREVILRYAVRRCPQPADVADLVAETFLAAISAAPGFDPSRGSAEAWLIGIARNHWARRCEREARQRRLGERSLGDSLSSDDIGRLEERIDSVRRSAEVEGAIATLAEHHREVLWLIGSDGLSVAEAAAALGVSPGTFRVRLLRARRALRAALDAGHTASPSPISAVIREVSA